MSNGYLVINSNKKLDNSSSKLSFQNDAYSGSTKSIEDGNNNPLKAAKNLKNVYLSWKCLSVTVPNSILSKCRKKSSLSKTIFKNADGLVKPGEMLALMGASGSGKTTLLNVLNFRSASNLKIEGDIMINGMPANSKKISKVSSYIEQDYLFFGTLTGN